MSVEDFQIIDDTSIDISIFKRAFMKLHHQQGAQLNDSKQGVDFTFGEKTIIIK